MNWPPAALLGLLLVLASANLSLAWLGNGWLSLVGKANKPKGPYIQDYDNMNEILADTTDTDTDEPAKFFAEVRRWQNPEYQKSLTTRHRNLLRQIEPKAIERFLALQQVLEELNCDLKAHEVIRNNELSTGVVLMAPSKQIGSLRAIDLAIRNVAQVHADQCRMVYPKQFELVRKGLKQEPEEKQLLSELHDLMQAFADNIEAPVFHPEHFRKDRAHVTREKLANFSASGDAETNAIYEHLVSLTRRQPREAMYLRVLDDRKQRNKRHIIDHKVAELLQKYVFSRCEFLDDRAGHILTPAAYEQRIYGRKAKYNAATRELSMLIMYLEYHRICNLMLGNKKIIERNLILKILDEDKKEREARELQLRQDGYEQ